MIVARQFIAWYPCENGNRPVGHGMIGSDRRATIRTIDQPGIRIRPYPIRDGFSIEPVPGNKLPGYDHSVPPGHNRGVPSRQIYMVADGTVRVRPRMGLMGRPLRNRPRRPRPR